MKLAGNKDNKIYKVVYVHEFAHSFGMAALISTQPSQMHQT
jgi:hypothetical protein